MNEKREILSAAKRRELEINAEFYEGVGLREVAAKIRAELAADDRARHEAGSTNSMIPDAEIINLCQHVVRLNDGTEYQPSGVVARVVTEYTELNTNPTCYSVVYGGVTWLPEPQDGVKYIVSGMVAAACPERHDLLVPATEHPDAVRKDGQVYSVPGFIVPQAGEGA